MNCYKLLYSQNINHISHINDNNDKNVLNHIIISSMNALFRTRNLPTELPGYLRGWRTSSMILPTVIFKREVLLLYIQFLFYFLFYKFIFYPSLCFYLFIFFCVFFFCLSFYSICSTQRWTVALAFMKFKTRKSDMPAIIWVKKNLN